MINEIYLDNIASYKRPVTLSLKNKVALIYGLNGSGKSTISNYLYKSDDPAYAFCKIKKDLESEVLVYNQLFLDDNFYIADSLKGIFSLSKVNKDVLATIELKKHALNNLQNLINDSTQKIQTIDEQIEAAKQVVIDQIWEIKTEYTGGDRVFEYCLTGLKRKEYLFEHISSISNSNLVDDINQLKLELNSVSGENASQIQEFDNFQFTGLDIEENDLFKKIIAGSQDGAVAQFINTLGNSDWVRTGLKFIPTKIGPPNANCPFCQNDTLTKDLISSIKNVFDGTYEFDIQALEIQNSSYSDSEAELIFNSLEELSLLIKPETLQLWKTNTTEILSNFRENKLLINQKIRSPSSQIYLKSNRLIVNNINNLILEINKLIKSHNTKINKKDETLLDIKNRFWLLMRNKYDASVATFQKTNSKLLSQKKSQIIDLDDNTLKFKKLSLEIIELNSKTLNIEEAVFNINNNLSEIGITGFTIAKHVNDLYRIARSDENTDAFHTLSEGEKTMISFLYFLELCKGQSSTTNTTALNKKIIVIDDPISSLSHIYVFNIGQLIKRVIFDLTKFEQILVLTHSLYFFYELTETNKNTRHATQNLFRILKNSEGSNIIEMKYEEIQNDYQTYWAIIKDPLSQPALIANCMRNIIEYFFNFVEKYDFNNVFQKAALSNNKYRAFYRYMNRESHSLGQNIFDIKEFDYDNFKEGLQHIFKECGYEKHYITMMK